MRWYVSNQGAVIGPLESSEVKEGIDRGRVTQGMHVRDELGQWMPIEHSPFGGLFGGAPAYRPSNSGETIGVLLLLTPFFGSGFIAWRVSNMNLLQDPMSTLMTLTFGVIGLCAVLIAVEASQLKMGSVRNSMGKMDSGPVAWAVATGLFFIIAYPWYLLTRSRYGKSNYVVGGAIVAILFTAVTFAMGQAIEEQKARVRSVISGFR